MIKIKNATLISMSDSRDKLEKEIDILIDGNKIIRIDKNLNIQVEKEIDASGKIVMPGLINTHSHVPMSIFRESADGYLLQDWLNNVIWPKEAKLTNDDIYYASILSFLEMIKTGTTTVNDMYFMTDNIIKAALDTNIRLQTTRTLMDTSSNFEGENRLNELQQLMNKYNNVYETITLNVGIHGLYTTNRNYIKKCIEFARKNNMLVNMHFCENVNEKEDIYKIYDESAIEVLNKEFNNINILLAHAVKLDKLEIKKLSEMNKVSISHCPVSNLKLGCGIANISEMLKNNINITLGTDGQGSGCNLDLFEVMKFTPLLQKGINENALELPAYEVLKMATINGAKALNLNKIGSIEEGNIADLIILDLNNLVTQPINDIFSNIVYNVKGCNVDTTIVNGKILMENKILNTNIDEKFIYNKCKEIIDRIS